MAKILPWRKPKTEPIAVAEPATSTRPMVEVALPAPREPALTRTAPVEALEEPETTPLPLPNPPTTAIPTDGPSAEVEPLTPSTPPGAEPISRSSLPSLPVAVETAIASTWLVNDGVDEARNDDYPDILADAPTDPQRREVIEFVNRAADEIPSEVEKVLRYWLELNDIT